MASGRCSVGFASCLLLVALLALLQTTSGARASFLVKRSSDDDGETQLDELDAGERGAISSAVKKNLDEDADATLDSDNDDESSTSPTAAPGLSKSSLPTLGLAREEDEEADAVVDPLNHEGQSKAAEESDEEHATAKSLDKAAPGKTNGTKAAPGGSRNDMFDVEEQQDGDSPMIVLKIHPLNKRKNRKPGQKAAHTTLSPVLNKIINETKAMDDGEGGFIMTIKPGHNMADLNKLNKTGKYHFEQHANPAVSLLATESKVVKGPNGSALVVDGTTTKVPILVIKTTPKPANATGTTAKASAKPAGTSAKPNLPTIPKVSLKPTVKNGTSTTKKPTKSTKMPALTTMKPATTSKKPDLKLQATTIKPGMSTKMPGTSTKKPSTSTKMPATSTKKPSTSTKMPATSTKMPATSTTKPIISTKTPITSTKVPSMSTTQMPPSNGKQQPVAKSTEVPKLLVDMLDRLKNKSRRRKRGHRPQVQPTDPLIPTTLAPGAGGCQQRPDCQCDYKEMKDSDKMLAVVITNRGGFKGRRLSSKAISSIMSGKLSAPDQAALMGNQRISVSANNSFVLPAGHYYFPHPVRFVGFTSP